MPALVALIVGLLAAAPLPALHPCDVQEAPEKYSNRIVRIRGVVGVRDGTRFATEGGCLHQVVIEMERDWRLETPPPGHRGLLPPSDSYSIAKGSEREMLAALREGSVEAFTEDMATREWTPIITVSPIHDQMWRRFLDRVHAVKGGRPKYRVTATLEGRLDDVGEGVAVRSPEGSVAFCRGFGYENASPMRLVVSRVVDFSFVRRR